MDLRKIAITGAVALSIGLAGIAGSGAVGKAISCAGAQVRLEHGKNWYCSNRSKFDSDFIGAREKMASNSGADGDYAFLALASEDDAKRNDLRAVLASKYDSVKKEFDGSKFGADVIGQLSLATEIISIENPNGLEITGDLTEFVGNYLSNPK